MKNCGLTFHHMGLALKKEDKALKFLDGIGYGRGEQVYDPLQKVNLRLCTSSDKPSIELVTPGEEEGPLTPILKRFSEVIYHICYETDDRELSLDAIKKQGSRVISVSPPTPAILFGGRKVSFHMVAGFGLIELLEP